MRTLGLGVMLALAAACGDVALEGREDSLLADPLPDGASERDGGASTPVADAGAPSRDASTDLPQVDGGPRCGTPPASCFSPWDRPERAYDEGAQGCPCDAGDESVCVGPAALICIDGRWTGVEDGPCYPHVISASACEAEGGKLYGGTPLRCPAYTNYLGEESSTGTLCCGPLWISPDACEALGARVYTDIGDGSLLREGCPEGELRGYIRFVETGLCCMP